MGNNILTRFNYWELCRYPQLSKLNSYMYFYSLVLGAIFSRCRNKYKKLGLFSLGTLMYYFIYLILQGNKFTSLFYMLLFFIIPIFSSEKIYNNIHLIKKGFLIFIVFTSVSLGISYYQYKFYYNYANPGETIVNRIFGLQGHVWWGTDMIVSNNNIDKDEQLKNEIKAIIHSDDENYTGMKYLMTLVAPQEISNRYIENNVNFTGGYPAILLVIMNPIGIIGCEMLLGLVLGSIIVYIDNKIRRNQILSIFLSGNILWALYYYYSMGSSFMLFSKTVLLCLIILIYSELFYKGKSKKILFDTI
ncbi:DUF6418 domain-containing protein [Clostridium beijerinckii]|uniref:DUF6418 domain-containing protein n=1 Tax=Clostridium beijerinckii TaxID=1520 RepID=UPI0023301C25|nr:DUF6418 domain-containing protein [Clostridium beijerinckii]